jgi:hypothetical protein
MNQHRKINVGPFFYEIFLDNYYKLTAAKFVKVVLISQNSASILYIS